MKRNNKILIVLENKKDYKLIADLLGTHYEVIDSTDFTNYSRHFDLLILDGITHNRYRDWVITQKKLEDPRFLPVLILTRKKDIDIAASSLWKTVDELLILPINKTELLARVEILLRTRNQSKQLQYFNQKIIQLSKDKLAIAVKSANVGLWDWDLKTNKVYYSPEWKSQIGYEETELTDEFSEWEKRVHPDDIDRCLDYVNLYLKNPRPEFHQEFRFRHRDGSYRWILAQASLLYDEVGKPERMIGSHIDITEAKQAELNLKLYKQAVDQNSVGIAITDKNGYFIYFNKAFENITGYSFEEAKGNSPRIIKSQEHTVEFYRNLWDTLLSGKIWKGEFLNKRKNGDLYWARSIISPMFNSKNEITHFVAVQQDVTSEIIMLEELTLAKQKAEKSNHLKSAFLANISHEIRTPMNGILGFIELLKEPDLSEETKAHYLDIVNKSGKRLINTINDIIEVSRIDSKLIPVKISRFCVISVIKDLIKFFEPEATQKGLKFLSNLPDEILEIESDLNKIESILSNLIKNALKFTDKGIIEISLEKKDMKLLFCVKDTGKGIPPEIKEIIFERFVQGSEIYSKPNVGSGLGLSIAKGYIELLGGNITVESEVGKGSTFCFTLPFDNPLEESSIKTENIISEKFEIKNKLKFLIAEDDKNSLELLMIFLKDYSKEILTANNGLEAVEICKSNPDIDIILMDILMPIMNGYEATKQIRQFNKTVSIIALTAFALYGDMDNINYYGCNGYISKPVSKLKLLTEIRRNIKNF